MLILILTTILVTASGNIINDIYDVAADKINKPEKQIVGKSISIKKSWGLYITFSLLGIGLGFVFAYSIGILWFGFLFLVIELLLWAYSFWLKKIILIGNVVVALLSALVLFFVWLPDLLSIGYNNIETYFILVYSFFAFLVSLVREIIKDIEDVKGDAITYNHTLAIVLGKSITKTIVSLLIVLLITIIALFQYDVWHHNNYIIVIYLMLLVQLPLIGLLYKNISASTQLDFHKAGTYTKMIMITGVLSMLFI